MRRAVVLTGILIAAAAWVMVPEAFALKKVFGIVTLREPVAITVGQLGKPVATKRVTPDTLQYAWVDEGPGKYLFAYATRGRVSAVWADYEPRTWLTLRKSYAVLQRKYGEPKNLDFFPEEAKSDGSKSKAIASGKGKVSRSWNQGESGIELLWEQDGLILRYFEKELWAKVQKAIEDIY